VTLDAESKTARIELDGRTYELPVVIGTEGEHGIDIATLRSDSNHITVDPGYRNTGSVLSDITFIDGEEGTLRYRGYDIADLCENCTFLATAWLLFFGELPRRRELDNFQARIDETAQLSPEILRAVDAFPERAHPMARLGAMIHAIGCGDEDPEQLQSDQDFLRVAARLMSQARTLIAAGYKASIGRMPVPPGRDMGYAQNFLHMMFDGESNASHIDDDAVEAMELILILHADHEQNCSTSTVRMVGSSGASLFASCSAGVSALWGPLHGGANVAVIEQLTRLHTEGADIDRFMGRVKEKKERLFGFGHGVYKNYDPRARILKSSADKVLANLQVDDPLLEIAKRLEQIALNDDYFVSRKLYPNVDFYSGIIMRAIGIPENMFTTIFALGRLAGWIAQWKEVRDQQSRIYRPRQIYTGPPLRHALPIDQRG